jgi:hypothetical protein
VQLILQIVIPLKVVLQYGMKRKQVIDMEKLGFVLEYLVEMRLQVVILVMKHMFGIHQRKSVFRIRIGECVREQNQRINIIWRCEMKVM